jgi:hypothetical protein
LFETFDNAYFQKDRSRVTEINHVFN